MRIWGGLPTTGPRRRHLALAVIAPLAHPPAARRSRRPFPPGRAGRRRHRPPAGGPAGPAAPRGGRPAAAGGPGSGWGWAPTSAISPRGRGSAPSRRAHRVRHRRPADRPARAAVGRRRPGRPAPGGRRRPGRRGDYRQTGARRMRRCCSAGPWAGLLTGRRDAPSVALGRGRAGAADRDV